ncbi:MAG: hypothetical protein QMC81_00855 [Thermoanaerobacterales bacterium]|nr:hypothetical protein [Thermoanaerobacterales bacterium]
MKYPFEVSPQELKDNLDTFVSVVFSTLESEFLVLPRGVGFIDYPVFEEAYEKLKRVTSGFRVLTAERVFSAVLEKPVALIVLRAIIGITPSEWAYLTTQRTNVAVSQSSARALDRAVRMDPKNPIRGKNRLRWARAMVDAACALLSSKIPTVGPNHIHRLEKVDTKNGPEGIRAAAELGVPYAMLLYERFLGRPFAGHRDSVSELIGDGLETVIENLLSKAGVSYRKTKRAERIEGFDQAPDFIVPSEFNPRVVIEAKICEDDGTARDKVTRIQHLAELSLKGRPAGSPRFEVVACIGGRGFGVRREDMRKLLLATHGKVFTLETLDRLVDYTGLKEFRTREP